MYTHMSSALTPWRWRSQLEKPWKKAARFLLHSLRVGPDPVPPSQLQPYSTTQHSSLSSSREGNHTRIHTLTCTQIFSTHTQLSHRIKPDSNYATACRLQSFAHPGHLEHVLEALPLALLQTPCITVELSTECRDLVRL